MCVCVCVCAWPGGCLGVPPDSASCQRSDRKSEYDPWTISPWARNRGFGAARAGGLVRGPRGESGRASSELPACAGLGTLRMLVCMHTSCSAAPGCWSCDRGSRSGAGAREVDAEELCVAHGVKRALRCHMGEIELRGSSQGGVRFVLSRSRVRSCWTDILELRNVDVDAQHPLDDVLESWVWCNLQNG